ncbi:AbrB family transcriptional regulator [Salirhabdus salicampi]|uniref:AbrB family transcriptional regulator n=1 Tax=Salirhabdus salicampi TaxID=476102 RepID=UPI0020C51644|nr:AbrB family transcriptional regulator [Salirhabdus salicampi]
MSSYIFRLCVSLLLGLIGGGIFYVLSFPLPWILGPLFLLIIYKAFSGKTATSLRLRNVSFVLLGIQIGTTFTHNTLSIVTPYIIPYLLLALFLIVISLVSAYILLRKTTMDMATNMLGAVPGGLSAMIALSEEMDGNTVYVTISHTIRLLAVLFIVPFSAIHFFANHQPTTSGGYTISIEQGPLFTVLLYFLFFWIAKLCSMKVPASFVIIPMLCTAFFQMNDIPLFHLPAPFFIGSQIILGVYLGNTVSIEALRNVGKYGLLSTILAIMLIVLSFGLGYLFHVITSMDMATAMLSVAPGGLVEMALTAQDVGGDPSVVSSLQAIRLLLVVVVLPFALKIFIPKFQRKYRKKLRSNNVYDKN